MLDRGAGLPCNTCRAFLLRQGLDIFEANISRNERYIDYSAPQISLPHIFALACLWPIPPRQLRAARGQAHCRCCTPCELQISARRSHSAVSEAPACGTCLSKAKPSGTGARAVLHVGAPSRVQPCGVRKATRACLMVHGCEPQRQGTVWSTSREFGLNQL